MTFDEAITSSGLGAVFAPDKIVFTEENAILISLAAKLVPLSPACFGVIWRSEASPPYAIWSIPQTNETKNPTLDPEFMDYGPPQINKHLWHEDVRLGNIKVNLPDSLLFGDAVKLPDGTYAKFNGDPLISIMGAGYKMLSIHLKGTDPQTGVVYPSADAERCCRYTGPTHRERRLQIFNQLEKPLTDFFNLYKGMV